MKRRGKFPKEIAEMIANKQKSKRKKEVLKAHDWQRLSLEGGSNGTYSVWRCKGCEATNVADPDEDETPSDKQFLSCGCGPNEIGTGKSCDTVEHWIKEHLKLCPSARCTYCNMVKSAHGIAGKTRGAPGACTRFMQTAKPAQEAVPAPTFRVPTTVTGTGVTDLNNLWVPMTWTVR